MDIHPKRNAHTVLTAKEFIINPLKGREYITTLFYFSILIFTQKKYIYIMGKIQIRALRKKYIPVFSIDWLKCYFTIIFLCFYVTAIIGPLPLVWHLSTEIQYTWPINYLGLTQNYTIYVNNTVFISLQEILLVAILHFYPSF